MPRISSAKLSSIKEFLDEVYGTRDPKKPGQLPKEKQRLLVHGKDTIKKIALCVSTTGDTIRAAAKIKADMIFSHNIEDTGTASKENNQAYLKDRGITLYTTGILMDSAYVYGTDYALARALGLKTISTLDKKARRGVTGASRIDNYKMLEKRINWLTHSASESYKNNEKSIRCIAIYTGETPSRRIISLSSDNSCDTMICNSGDISLKTSARDLGINLFIANYTETERLGLEALKKTLDELFRIETIILDETDY